MKQIFFAVALLLIISSVSALIQPEKNEISISGTEVFSLPVKIRNTTDEKILVHLISKGALKTEFRSNDFYLNPGEETKIALDILPFHSRGAYYIELRMEYGGNTEYSNLDVRIGRSTGRIDVRYYRQNICQNRLDKLSLWVRNETGEPKRINLSVDSEMFMATIEPNLIDLDSGEEKFVELEILSNLSYPLDEYSVNVYLESDNTIVSKEVFFDLVECFEIEREFRLSVPNDITVRKGETKKVYFTIRNLEDEENEIEFAVRGNLETELQQTKTVLEENESRRYWIEVTALESNETGRQKIELYAFNPFYEQRKTFYVNVRGIHEIKSILLNNELKIERGHSEIFTLLVENNGNFEERIEINSEGTENINVHLTERNFYLEEKEAKKVYISVNPAITSDLGDYKIKVEVNGKELFLKFSVIEEKKPLLTEGIIEFFSAPKKITLKNEENTVRVVIKNISGEKIENIAFWIEDLPQGVSFESTILKEIDTGKTKTMQGTLLFDSKKTEKGSYEISLVFENSQFRQKKEIMLIILEEEKENKGKEEDKTENNNLLAGLFSLGSGQLIGLLVIAIIIIILLLNPGNPKKGKKTWLNYKGE